MLIILKYRQTNYQWLNILITQDYGKKLYTLFELIFGHFTKQHVDIPETLSITANNRINHMENIWTNTKQAYKVAKNIIN